MRIVYTRTYVQHIYKVISINKRFRRMFQEETLTKDKHVNTYFCRADNDAFRNPLPIIYLVPGM